MQPARVQSRDMEKLRRREERDARHTWSRVVDYCAANQVSRGGGGTLSLLMGRLAPDGADCSAGLRIRIRINLSCRIRIQKGKNDLQI
jgi:hypothetical protein